MVSVRLFCACPPPCTEPAKYWIHNECGGDSYLTVNGDITCAHCSVQGFIKGWCFSCYGSKHGEDRWLNFSSVAAFDYALSVGERAMLEAGKLTPDILIFNGMLRAKIRERYGYS